MDKFLTYLGGSLGGYILTQLELGGTFMSGTEMFFDTVGALGMVVFSGAFLYHGLRSLWGK